MACPPYTAGDLKSLQVINEVTFGTTPATALKYAGDLQNISGGDTNMNATKQRYGGSRTFDEMIYEAPSFGFSGSFLFKNVAKTKDWATVWGTYALGNLTGPIRKLPTFSALIQGGPSTYNLASGCMVDSLKISGNGLGKEITFDANVKCRAIQTSPDRSFTGIQTVTVGANDVIPPITEVLHMMDFPTVTTEKTPIKSWSLSIANAVFGVPDKVGSQILANGNCLASDGVDISLTLTRLASNEGWTDLKYNRENNISVSIPIGERTVNLTGGAITGNDFPTRTQGQYDENLTIEFKNIAIV